MSTEVKDDVSELISIDADIKSLEEELKQLKKIRRDVESRIAEEWGALGKDNEKRGDKTVYRARVFQVSGRADRKADLKTILVDNGMGDFISDQVSMPTLKSWIQEHAPLDEAGDRDYSSLPDQLLECLSIYEDYAIRVRKA